ncbi:hypothetical protein QJQ45_013995 [Haematococcus lacustris]|nr:hypothetical protein QJQ45_013995 [Haematococcus lacustris]
MEQISSGQHKSSQHRVQLMFLLLSLYAALQRPPATDDKLEAQTQSGPWPFKYLLGLASGAPVQASAELAALQTRTAQSSAQALSDTALNTIGISSPQQQQQPQQWQQAQLEGVLRQRVAGTHWQPYELWQNMARLGSGAQGSRQPGQQGDGGDQLARPGWEPQQRLVWRQWWWEQAAQALVKKLGKAQPVRQGQEAQEQGQDHRLLGQGQGQRQQRSLLQSPSPRPSSPTRSGPSQISLNDLLSGCNDCGSVSLNIDLGGLGLGKIQANIPIPKVPPQPKPAKPLPQHPALPNPPGITINDLRFCCPIAEMSPKITRKRPASPAPTAAVAARVLRFPTHAGASGSGQKDLGDEGQGDKEVIGHRRQVTKAALRGLVEAARFDFSQPQVDVVVAEVNKRMTMGSNAWLQSCVSVSFLGQPSPGSRLPA